MSLFDEIGTWTEVKLDIIREYAAAYSRVLAAPKQRERGLSHVYIDAFAGPGYNISRQTGILVQGSPINALYVEPAFAEYHFIDIDEDKAETLREIVGDRPDVHIYPGDCNTILLTKVFPRAKWDDFRRGLCLLDPYGLHLDWEVIRAAGEMKSIDMFLNFPVMDMNRNVLWRNPEKVDPWDIERMNRFWGDESWKEVAYKTTPTLFGEETKRADMATIAAAFGKRLQTTAGFKHVPDPVQVHTAKGQLLYYLFFASPKPVAAHIVTQIFGKYRASGR